MRELTRNEVRRLAKAAGLQENDPTLFDGRAEALIRVGMELGMLFQQLQSEKNNANRNLPIVQ